MDILQVSVKGEMSAQATRDMVGDNLIGAKIISGKVNFRFFLETNGAFNLNQSFNELCRSVRRDRFSGIVTIERGKLVDEEFKSERVLRARDV